jgi:toxin-antitoxin system PIN domain toxin
MTIVDANVLLYAYNADAPQQPAAARWLQELLKTGETIGLPWITLWAFIRIATNSRIWSNALSSQQAFAIVEEWMAQPGVVLLQPGPRHVEILKRIAIQYAVAGPLMTDAVLAAMALENGAVLASTDHGFRRFAELRWTNPLGRS